MIQVVPYFSLASAASVPWVVLWDEKTNELRRAEGPKGFPDYRHAVQASRFLCAADPLDII